jgi:hypothetical protein
LFVFRNSTPPATQYPGAVHEIAVAEPPSTPELMGRGVIVTPAPGVVVGVVDVVDDTVVVVTGVNVTDVVVVVTGAACATELSARELKVAATATPTRRR